MRSIFLSLLLALTACSSEKSAIMQQSNFDARPALIFIHGYYGSALRDAETHRRIFVTAREVLFGRNSLSLHQKELATPPGPKLEVEGLLGGVRILPGLYNIDVYGDFIQSANDLPGVQVVPLVYDWREDLTLAVNQLDELVKALRAKGVTKIAIMAHSMGGLVASYYLGYGNQPPENAKLNWAGASQISRIIFMGTPFRGAFSVFRNMQRGADFSWNRYLLPADAVASFPASYALIPIESELLDRQGRAAPAHLFDFSFWEKYSLGLLRTNGLSKEIMQARIEFTAAQLKRARLFVERANFFGEKSELPASLPVMNVMGKGRETVARAYFDSANGDLFFDTDKLSKEGLDEKALFADGDGTVVGSSSILPAALQKHAKVLFSKLAHDRLFEDEAIKKELPNLFTQ